MKLIKCIAVIYFLLVLTACGGGGGGGSTPATSSPGTTSTPTSFTAAAMAGELLTYTVDTTSLTYSYTITASQYGLTGRTGSGTLTLDADGTYSPSGMTNSKVVVLPNGLLLGAIREIINGTLTTIPIYGVKSPVTTFAEAAGTYNYVDRFCIAPTCFSGYGTFNISPGGLWSSCASGNLTTGCTGIARNGTLNNLGGGLSQVVNGTTVIGTALAFNSGNQKVIVLDLNNAVTGLGLLVGSEQEFATTDQANGTWVGSTTTGFNVKFIVAGTTITRQTVNGVASTATTTLTINSPWAGMASTSSGGKAILAGTGVYAFQNAGGFGEIGLKLQ